MATDRTLSPRHLRALLPWILLAPLLAGCGDSGPGPSTYTEERALVRAVTLPASLAAGESVYVRVNLDVVACPWSFMGWRVLHTTAAAAWVAPILRRPNEGILCPAYLPPPAVVSYPARVPNAGLYTLHFVGSNDTLDVALSAGDHAATSGHTVRLVPTLEVVRTDSVAVSFFLDGANPAQATARTDLQGEAVETLPCPVSGSRWNVFAFDPVQSQLFWLFDLPLDAWPCDRALLTAVSYQGNIVAVPLTAGGSPWARRGWRL